MADYREKVGKKRSRRQTGAYTPGPIGGGGGGDDNTDDETDGGTDDGGDSGDEHDPGEEEGSIDRKPAAVTTITTNRQTVDKGQFVNVIMTMEAPNADAVYAGDLVVEVDGETVHQEEVHVGQEDLSITLPVKINEPGEHTICATLVEPIPTSIPIEDF